MRVLKLQKERYRIAKSLVNRRVFGGWIETRGMTVHTERYRRTKCRWFFGRQRAKRALYREARESLTPDSAFAIDLERRLDELPVFIRKIALTIRRDGYRDLFSADGTKALIVVPRGKVQNDFTAYVVKRLEDAPQLRRFPGLARTILKTIAREAETLLFDYVFKGKQPVDKTGRGLLIGVDPDCRWRLSGVDGHYLYACTMRNQMDLHDKRDLKAFKQEMDEIRKGQEVYIRRLPSHERAAIAAAFELPTH